MTKPTPEDMHRYVLFEETLRKLHNVLYSGLPDNYRPKISANNMRESAIGFFEDMNKLETKK